jgi:anthranilate synthase component 1
MDMAIAIRTAVVDRRGASVQAGAGIVADSDPVREFKETCTKAAAPLAAIGGILPKGMRL